MSKLIYMGNISSSQRVVLPYTCGILRSYSEQTPDIKLNYSWAPFIFHTLDGVKCLADEVVDPDVLGLSCYVWNTNRSIKLAKLVKEKYPSCLVVLGGPSIPRERSEFFKKHPYVDILVHNEGEFAFRNILLENLETKPTWKRVEGISHKNGTSEASKGLPQDIKYNSSYSNGYMDSCIKELNERGLPKTSIIETIRGCPFSCIFCQWGYVGNKLKLFDWNSLVKDIEYISTMTDELILADANFGIHERDVGIANEIAKGIDKYKKIKTLHVCYTKSDLDRVAKIAKVFGSRHVSRSGVTIALQTITPEVLKLIKRSNPSKEKIEKLEKQLKDYAVPYYFDLIVGLPGETVDSLMCTVEELLERDAHNIMFRILTLLPNTEVNSKQMRDKFELKGEMVKIHSGHEDDEDEFFEHIKETKDMQDFNWIRKWKEVIEYLHFGKWTYFIATYLKREKGVRYVDFYKKLTSFAFENKESVLGKCVTGWYIKNYNSGSYISFEGPYSPHGIDWGKNFFFKQTFFWLCISENRDDFWNELKGIVKGYGDFENLFEFQRDMMIKFDFEPFSKKYHYNWIDYFNGEILEKREVELEYRTKTIGRHKTEFKPNDPSSFFYVAGGDEYYFQKMNTFVHNEVI